MVSWKNTNQIQILFMVNDAGLRTEIHRLISRLKGYSKIKRIIFNISFTTSKHRDSLFYYSKAFFSVGLFSFSLVFD